MHVNVALTVFVQVAASAHDTVPIEVNLVDRLWPEARQRPVLVALDRRDLDHVYASAEANAQELPQCEVDRLIADVEALGAHAEDVDHAINLPCTARPADGTYSASALRPWTGQTSS